MGSKLFFGVDPGLSGAIASIDGDTLKADIASLKYDEKDLDADWLRKYIYDKIQAYDLTILTFEKVQGNPKFPGNAAFTFGSVFGQLKAVVKLMSIDHNIRLIHPIPSVWQKKLLTSTGKTKEDSIAFCKMFYPKCSLVPPKCRSASNDWSDALCIAHYGLMLYGNVGEK
jgi:hypothetical protein